MIAYGIEIACKEAAGRSESFEPLRQVISILTGTIQDDSLHNWSPRSPVELLFEVCEGTVMAPVAYQYRIPSLVPVGTARTMDEQWSSHPIGILQRIVTVVPAMAILYSLEIVSVRISCCNRALRDAVYSVGFICMKLADAMPVNGAPIGLHIVCDVYCDIIAPAGFNQWARVRVVEDFPFGL